MRQADGARGRARDFVAVYPRVVCVEDAYARRAGVAYGVARDYRVQDRVLAGVGGQADGAVRQLELVLAARVERRAAARVQADVFKRVVAHRDAAQVSVRRGVEPAAQAVLLDAAVAGAGEAVVLDRGARRGGERVGRRQGYLDGWRGQARQAFQAPERQAADGRIVGLYLHARAAREDGPACRAVCGREGKGPVYDEDRVVVRPVRHDDDAGMGRGHFDRVNAGHVARRGVHRAPCGRRDRGRPGPKRDGPL